MPTLSVLSLIHILAPVAGVWVERVDRRKMLVWTQAAGAIQSLALAALTLAHVITIGEIIALAALQGLINAFDMPGRQAFLVQMVEDRSDLGNACLLYTSRNRSRYEFLAPFRHLLGDGNPEREQCQLEVPRLQQQVAGSAGEHLGNDEGALPQIGGAEKDPADRRQSESKHHSGHRQKIPAGIDPPFPKGPFDTEQQPLIAAPDQEVPTRSMP